MGFYDCQERFAAQRKKRAASLLACESLIQSKRADELIRTSLTIHNMYTLNQFGASYKFQFPRRPLVGKTTKSRTEMQ